MSCGLVEGALTVDRDLQACPHPCKDTLTQLSGRLFTFEAQSNGGRGGGVAIFSFGSHPSPVTQLNIRLPRVGLHDFLFLTNIKWFRSPWPRDKLCLDTPSTSRHRDDQRKWAVRLLGAIAKHMLSKSIHTRRVCECVHAGAHVCVCARVESGGGY